MQRPTILPAGQAVRRADSRTESEQPVGAVIATDDPELIRRWAARHRAEPATGEATPSGPATVDVRDGGAGIRFNFPASGRFRPITWDEWLAHFRRFDLLFVYERAAPDGASSQRYRLVQRTALRQAADPS
jgi:hypothetical protein